MFAEHLPRASTGVLILQCAGKGAINKKSNSFLTRLRPPGGGEEEKPLSEGPSLPPQEPGPPTTADHKLGRSFLNG